MEDAVFVCKERCNAIIQGVVKEDGEEGLLLGCEGRKGTTCIYMDKVTNCSGVFSIVHVQCLGRFTDKTGDTSISGIKGIWGGGFSHSGHVVPSDDIFRCFVSQVTKAVMPDFR